MNTQQSIDFAESAVPHDALDASSEAGASDGSCAQGAPIAATRDAAPRVKRKRRALGLAGVVAAIAVATMLVCAGVAPQGAAPDPGAALLGQGGVPGAAAPAEAPGAEAAAGADVAAAESQSAPASEAAPIEDLPAYREGVVLVSPAEGVAAPALQSALESLDVVADATVSDEEASDGVAEIELAPGADQEAALEQIGSLPETAGAQPDFYYYLDDTDLTATAASGLEAQDLAGASAATAIYPDATNKQWHLDSVFAYEAYQTMAKGLKGKVDDGEYATVAVLDTGCDTTHYDLQGQIAQDRYNAVDGSTSVEDEDGHGTHVAGVIAATAFDGRGVTGLGFNRVKVLPIKIFEQGTAASDSAGRPYTTTSLVRKALAYLDKVALGNNVRVANLSFGGANEGDGIMLGALRETALKNDILFVSAAGNDGSSTASVAPSDYMTDAQVNGISVMALDKHDDRLSFSNYNAAGARKHELSAPGQDIYSTLPISLLGSGSYGYGSRQGTSCAAPIVSAVAALASLASEANPSVTTVEPRLTAKELKLLLMSTAASSLGASAGGDRFDESVGWGKVDAYGAVDRALDEGVFDKLVDFSDVNYEYDPSGDDEVTSLTDCLELASVSGVKALTYQYGAEVRQSGIVVKTYSSESQKWHTLKVHKDYVIRYENNIDASRKSGESARMVIEGKGAYEGQSREIDFVIEPAPLNERGSYRWAKDINGNFANIKSKTTQYANEPVTPDYGDFNPWVDYTVDGYAGSEGMHAYDVKRHDLAVKSVDDEPGIFAKDTLLPNESLADRMYGDDADCVIAASNNTNAGLGSAWFVGVGNFCGSVLESFVIKPANINDADLAFEGQDDGDDINPRYYYTGAPINPSIVGSFNDSDLSKGKDFDVSYEHNVLPGTAIARVKGKGNFEGEQMLEFDIVSGALSDGGEDEDEDADNTPDSLMKQADVTVSDYTYTGKKIEPKPKVKLGSTTLKLKKHYTLSYGKNTTVKDSDDREAYVKITGVGTYKDYGSKIVRFKINPAPISKATLSGVKTKDLDKGDDRYQEVTLKYKGATLKEGDDYNLEYFGADVQCTAVLVARGMGNYTGSRTKSYTIKTKGIDVNNLAKAKVSGVKSVDYTGLPMVQDNLTVKWGKTELKQGTDYELEYWDNTAVGTATVCIYASRKSSDFCGAIVKTFKIKKPKSSDFDLKDAQVEYVKDYTFDGLSKKPPVTVTLGGRQLVEGVDYTKAYSKNVNVGTGTIKLTGVGAYHGSKKVQFNILGNLDNAEVSGLTDYTYNGKSKSPTPTVKLNGKKVSSKYYTVEYRDNTNAGVASVVVKGKNGYNGEATGTFTIKKAKNPMKVAVSAASIVTLSDVTASEDGYLTTGGMLVYDVFSPDVSVKQVGSDAELKDSPIYLDGFHLDGPYSYGEYVGSTRFRVKPGTPVGKHTITVEVHVGASQNYEAATVTRKTSVRVVES